MSFPTAIRNDNAATTLAGTNGQPSNISVDLTGRLFIAGIVPVTTSAVTWNRADYTFNNITASFTTALSNATSLRYMRFWNRTDVQLIVSFDGANDHLDLGIGAVETIDLSTNGRHNATTISVRRYSSAPTTGSFHVTVFS